MWYAANLIFSFEAVDKSATSDIVLEENIILLCANSENEANDKAILFGSRSNAKISYLDPVETRISFVGVRKIIAISNLDLDNKLPPGDGSEITYEILRFKSKEDVDSYLDGKNIAAQFWDAEH